MLRALLTVLLTALLLAAPSDAASSLPPAGASLRDAPEHGWNKLCDAAVDAEAPVAPAPLVDRVPAPLPVRVSTSFQLLEHPALASRIVNVRAQPGRRIPRMDSGDPPRAEGV